jgi:hypothetical protein
MTSYVVNGGVAWIRLDAIGMYRLEKLEKLE